MKTSSGNQAFDKLILAAGIIVAIIAGLSRYTENNPDLLMKKANMVKSTTVSNEYEKSKGCSYLKSMLTIN